MSTGEIALRQIPYLPVSCLGNQGGHGSVNLYRLITALDDVRNPDTE